MASSNMNSATTITNSRCYQHNNISGKLYGEILNELTEKVKGYVEEIVAQFKSKEVGFRYVIEVPKFCVGVIRRAI